MDRTTWLSQILSKSVFDFIYNIFLFSVSLSVFSVSLCVTKNLELTQLVPLRRERSQRYHRVAQRVYLIFERASIKASTEAVIISVLAEKP
jgi:hypothetical protein